MTMAILMPRGGTLYNGLYGKGPPERGAIFRLQMKGYGFHWLKYAKLEGKWKICHFVAQKGY